MQAVMAVCRNLDRGRTKPPPAALSGAGREKLAILPFDPTKVFPSVRLQGRGIASKGRSSLQLASTCHLGDTALCQEEANRIWELKLRAARFMCQLPGRYRRSKPCGSAGQHLLPLNFLDPCRIVALNLRAKLVPNAALSLSVACWHGRQVLPSSKIKQFSIHAPPWRAGTCSVSGARCRHAEPD